MHFTQSAFVLGMAENRGYDIDSKEFVSLIKKGDSGAFKNLYFSLYPKLLAYADSYLKSEYISEEICQEVFLYLWEKRGIIADDTCFLPYLLRITRNKSLNYIKSARLRPVNVGEWESEEMELNRMALEDSSANDLLVAELQELINQAVAEMPENCREVFLLSRDKGLKYYEISELTGIPLKTVESRMSKSLQIFRKRLSDYLTVVFF